MNTGVVEYLVRVVILLLINRKIKVKDSVSKLGRIFRKAVNPDKVDKLQ